jgi:predicted Rossmann-fold nucleotide-binding protein
MDSYYNSLLSFIDKVVDEGFIMTPAHHLIISAPTANELVQKLEVSGYNTLICHTNTIHGKREKGHGIVINLNIHLPTIPPSLEKLDTLPYFSLKQSIFMQIIAFFVNRIQ